MDDQIRLKLCERVVQALLQRGKVLFAATLVVQLSLNVNRCSRCLVLWILICMISTDSKDGLMATTMASNCSLAFLPELADCRLPCDWSQPAPWPAPEHLKKNEDAQDGRATPQRSAPNGARQLSHRGKLRSVDIAQTPALTEARTSVSL